ncbi:MAG TPA: O-antigen ligase family protein [Gaiellaceae bacterium]|nr:O-antigen ligase family protein [Gaiellaceae bacterium]
MQVLAGAGRRAPVASSAFVAGALCVLAWTVVEGRAVLPAAGVTLVLATLVAGHRTLFRWRNLVVALLLVILFVPIRRYKLAAGLPFDLEPYRLMVMFLIAGWLTSLLIDPRAWLRHSVYDRPVALIVAATFASELANPARVGSLGSYVVKSLTFFASFLLVFYVVVGVVRSGRDVDRIVRVLVGGGAVIAFFALIERRTGYNVFNDLGRVVPLLHYQGGWEGVGVERGGRLRVYGPAEHPIALGAALVMLLPLALYLIRSSGQRRWWVAIALLTTASLATASRTVISMLVAVVLVFLWLRPRETRRCWPALIPLLLVVHIAVPGAIGTMTAAFFPQGGLIKDQSTVVRGNALRADGRLAKVGPALRSWEEEPLFGLGFGTRVVGFQVAFNNAFILDDQWLGTLLDVGAVGTFAYLWLFVRAIRRCGRAAKADDSPRGWLLAALAAAIAAFAVGMLTFDAFSFIQVTFFFWIMLSASAALLAPSPRGRAAAGAVPAAARAGAA